MRHETVVGFDCGYCQAKILQMVESDKKATTEQILKKQKEIERRHFDLHHKADRYEQLKRHVNDMALITGEAEYDY